MRLFWMTLLLVSVSACVYHGKEPFDDRFSALPQEAFDSLGGPFRAYVLSARYEDGKNMAVVFVQDGSVHTGDTIELVGYGFQNQKRVISGLGAEGYKVDSVKAGDVEIFWFDEDRDSKLVKGMTFAKTGTIGSFSVFEAVIHMLEKEEGGRHTPFFNSFRPDFYLNGTDVNGKVLLQPGYDMVMPCDICQLTVTLDQPVALRKGTHFVLREKGHMIGTGYVHTLIH